MSHRLTLMILLIVHIYQCQIYGITIVQTNIAVKITAIMQAFVKEAPASLQPIRCRETAVYTLLCNEIEEGFERQ